MRVRVWLALAGMVLFVSGCGGLIVGAVMTARPLPFLSIMQYDAGEEFVMRGQLGLNIDMTSRVVIATDDGDVECSGDIDAKGKGTLICTGGIVFDIDIPREHFGKMSGAYTERGDNYTLAVGWGSGADEVGLRELLP